MKKILFLLLLTMSSVTYANWILVNEDAQATLYIDKSSIQQVGQFKRAWSKMEYSLNSEFFLKFKDRSSRSLFEYDCREKKSRRLTTTFFKQPNLIEQSLNDNKARDWEFIAPQSIGAKVIEIVCKN
jgi:hypothetical protein